MKLRDHIYAERQPPGGWSARAACLGMDPLLFFPTRGDDTGPAKAVCAGCPVQAECLEWALANREHYGIFGGTNDRERRSIARRRRRAA